MLLARLIKHRHFSCLEVSSWGVLSSNATRHAPFIHQKWAAGFLSIIWLRQYQSSGLPLRDCVLAHQFWNVFNHTKIQDLASYRGSLVTEVDTRQHEVSSARFPTTKGVDGLCTFQTQSKC